MFSVDFFFDIDNINDQFKKKGVPRMIVIILLIKQDLYET